MSRINEKMGMRPAGKRSMMKLPKDLATRVAVTSAVCPECGRRDAKASGVRKGWIFCTHCYHTWEPVSEAAL